MKKYLSLVSLFLIFIINSNAQVFGKVYEADSLKEIIANHKMVAVIPFTYQITLKKMPKNMTEADIKLQEEKGSLSAQNSFYTYALKKVEKKEVTVEVQDISRTKILLSRDSITEKNISNYLPEELCSKLGVDALITGDIIASQPMSEGAALATQILIGFSKTNQAKATIKVYDKTGKLIWSYGKEVSGGLGSDDDDMIRVLMRKTANRFPYFKD
ncbi:MAG: hypothetical protein IPG86_05105 [Chitinophagaceae bacterium]|nr:hypothetical protein [Chitinophagaceae bacterium]